MKARMRLTVEADLEIPDTGSTPGQRLEEVRRCLESLRYSTLPEVIEAVLSESQSTVVERITAVKGEVWNDNAKQAARRIAAECKATTRSAAFSTLTESEVQRLAAALGGDVWDSGGGVELIVVERPDGRAVAISEEAVGEYADIEALTGGQPPLNSIILV
jgi:hypothetical protein